MVPIRGSFGEKHVEITGGRAEIGNINEIIGKVEKIDSENETISQVFDASRIAGKKHLIHSSKLALEALENEEAFADSPSIELTCWTAGSRQINKSLEKVGVNEGPNQPVAVITIGNDSAVVRETQREIVKSLDLEVDEKVLEISEEKIEDLEEVFSITSEQLAVSTLEKIVLEKVALLSLEK